MTLYSAMLQCCNSKFCFRLMMLGFLVVGGPKLWAQSIPYSYDFESNDTSFHRNPVTESSAWRLANGGVSSSRCLISEYVTNALGFKAEEYFASKRLNLTAGNTYQVSFQSKVQFNNRRKVKLALNTTDSRAGSTLIHDFDMLTNMESYQTYSTTFSVDSSGYYFLIYYGEALTEHLSCPWFTDDFSVTLVNTPPTAMLVEPSNNSWFDPDQSVGLAATVSDADSNVTKVEFYEGSNKVAEDYTPNGLGIYTAGYLPANGGSQSLTAKVIDSYGATGTSSSRTINVRYLPQASITNLTAHTIYFEGIQPVRASASDADGTIQCMVFYLNNDSIGTDSTAPYEMNIPLVYDENQSEQTIQAKAVDNDGLTGLDEKLIKILPGTCALTTPDNSLRQIICMGDSVKLSSEEESETTGFQWIYKANPVSEWEEMASNKPGIFAHQPGYYAIIWTYENNAVCTTAVDTVSTLQISVPTVYVYGDQPALAMAQASGGAEPYSFTWSSYDSCMNATCDSVMISDFTGPVVVTVTDNNTCVVSDTVEGNHKNLPGACFKDLAEEMIFLNPDFPSALDSTERLFQEFIKHEKSTPPELTPAGLSNQVTNTIRIPVVFYILNSSVDSLAKVNPDSAGGGRATFLLKADTINTWATDSRVYDQVAAVNRYFGTNPIYYKGELSKIQICMVSKKSDGTYSTGIVRLNRSPIVPKKGFGFNQSFINIVSDYPEYNWSNCLRIVVGAERNQISRAFPATWSFADFNNAQQFDGLFLDFRFLGPADHPEINNRGAILLHEIGHWLNLYHTFAPAGTIAGQDGCAATNGFAANVYHNASGRETWDFVEDTPKMKYQWKQDEGRSQGTGPFAWFNVVRGCGQDSLGLRKMIANAMAYAPDSCVDVFDNLPGYAFTQGQRERMAYTLDFFRNSIWSTENLIKMGVQCAEPVAQFKTSTDYVCGTGTTSRIGLKPLVNPHPNLSYQWAITNGFGSGNATISSNGTTDSIVVTFHTGYGGGRMETLTLTVTDTITDSTYEASQTVYVGGVCPTTEVAKSKTFFGRNAGFRWVDTLSQPVADTSFLTISIADSLMTKGGSVTYLKLNGQTGFISAANRIWNGNFKRLAVTIQSDINSGQYGVCVPSPGDTNYVWLFSTQNGDSLPTTNGTFRAHKIHLSEINQSTPVLTNSSFNRRVARIKSGAPSVTSSTQTTKTNEKITAIPKCGGAGHWIITQGPKGSAGWEKKFYVYSTSDTGLIPVDTFHAVHASRHGFLKSSPDGQWLVNTFSTMNRISGYGTGENSWLFSFNVENGRISPYKELTIPLPSGTTKAPAYGASFSPDSRYIYLSINANPVGEPYSQTRIAGIYQFDTQDTTATILGTLVAKIPFESSPSQNLMLGADNKIYLSNTINPRISSELFSYYKSLPWSGKQVGVIHFPNNSDAMVQWSGPLFATRERQKVFSTGGLPNFVDAKPIESPPHGLTQADPIFFGNNPGNCCASSWTELNVACSGNDEVPQEYGNDVYFTFSLKRSSGMVFTRPLRVDVSGSDFPVNVGLEYYRTSAPIGWKDADTVFSNGALNVSDTLLNTYNTSDTTVQFRLAVDAQNPAATGFFRVKVNYRHYDGTSNGLSCCRMAVAGGEETKLPSLEPDEYTSKPKGLLLYPNPAQNQLTIETPNAWESYKVVDMQGRTVLAGGHFSRKFDLSTELLTNGLYRLMIFGKAGGQSGTFQILK